MVAIAIAVGLPLVHVTQTMVAVVSHVAVDLHPVHPVLLRLLPQAAVRLIVHQAAISTSIMEVLNWTPMVGQFMAAVESVPKRLST